MTVTPLSAYPTGPRGRRAVARRRAATPVAPARAIAPALTIAFQIQLTGERRYSDALDILDALREITNRLGGATLEISPGADDDDDDDDGPAVPVTRLPTLPLPDDGSIQILPDARSVTLGDAQVELTRVEFDLLTFLAEHPRRVFSRTQLLRSVWGYEHTGERTVDVHIRRLRSKLGDALVTTVRSVGYRLADEVNIRVVRLR